MSASRRPDSRDILARALPAWWSTGVPSAAADFHNGPAGRADTIGRFRNEGTPYVTSISHVHACTLLHDPDASRSWISAPSRAAASGRPRSGGTRWAAGGGGPR